MSYVSIAEMVKDQYLQERVTACSASEGEEDPTAWAYTNRWKIAAQPGWAEKWDAAQAGGITNPGRDSSVITDADILSAVQAIRSEQFVSEDTEVA